MPTPSVRHQEVVGSLGPNGFAVHRDHAPARPKAPPARHREPARPTHTTVNIHMDAAPPRRSAPRVPTRDAARDAVAILNRMKDQADALGRTYDRMGDFLTRVRDALAPVVEARRAVTRDAGLATLARYQGVAPAAVQAANEARWGRGGR